MDKWFGDKIEDQMELGREGVGSRGNTWIDIKGECYLKDHMETI